MRSLFPDARFVLDGWAPVCCPFLGHRDPRLPLLIRPTGRHWCIDGCGHGDELAFVIRLKGVTALEAMEILSGCNR